MPTLYENRRAALMSYCRIDSLETDEEQLLEALYYSAVNYMTQAGISEPPEGTTRRAQYDLCVNALVLDSWDIRGISVDGKTTENPAFRRALNQLKLTETGEVL